MGCHGYAQCTICIRRLPTHAVPLCYIVPCVRLVVAVVEDFCYMLVLSGDILE